MGHLPRSRGVVSPEKPVFVLCVGDIVDRRDEMRRILGIVGCIYVAIGYYLRHHVKVPPWLDFGVIVPDSGRVTEVDQDMRGILYAELSKLLDISLVL